MKRSIFLVLFCTVLMTGLAGAQTNNKPLMNYDKISLGLGFGQDFGGIGANLLIYPQKNVGIFGGVGYALAGAGFNAGIKVRFMGEKNTAKVIPFAIGMYGYNAAIKVSGSSDLNKIFYGPTIGGGIDYKAFSSSKIYWSLAIFVPLRSSEVDNYIDDLKNNHGVTMKQELIPVTFSLGFRFILN